MPNAGPDATSGTDVVVVGAGPVGLLLAGELALRGVAVTVLERLAAPTGESRATHLNARTMELLDQRGLGERFGAVRAEPGTHFGGIPVDLTGLPSHRRGLWPVPQPRVEAVLADWTRELGVDVRRGYAVRALTATASGVEVSGDGFTVQARYLVGCDGEESTVRELAGFELAGSAATRVLYRADLDADLPERRLRQYPGGLATAARRGDGTTRIMVHEFGGPSRRGARTPGFATVAAAWQRVTGEDIGAAHARWLDAFDDAALQATRYRIGRVLLAGDAAHVQMPVGGQAINLGLQDAVNLGWKLAARLRGTAAADLLDTYHDERHPAAARVLRLVTAQAALLFGGAAVGPLRTVLGELIAEPRAGAHLASALSGLDERHPPGGGDPLLGGRIPHVRVHTGSGPSDTTALLRTGRGVLLDLGGGDRFATEVAGWTGRVDLHRVRVSGPLAAVDALLVRPDGHIAWTSNGPEALPTSLHRWFGAPDRHRTTAHHRPLTRETA
ncbi:FAD-dependent monooxygenase [Krasilnikovia sp. MM14-A1004]|uniref:FAD-dependent monooxygenase n=1 Tax=Krasilnikovia sp. MM14-A1004 TaxID=3373541 RepID=UPI00399D4E57